MVILGNEHLWKRAVDVTSVSFDMELFGIAMSMPRDPPGVRNNYIPWKIYRQNVEHIWKIW